MISKEISGLLRARQASRLIPTQQRAAIPYNEIPIQVPPASYGDIRARDTGELVPPSVTENTTKLFDTQSRTNG